jgi:NADH:ubiquinone oxidoreductase subunit D
VNKPYDVYKFFKFQVPTGNNGDCYDRYKVRIEEMRQSINIILQAIDQIPTGTLISNNFVFSRSKSLFKSSMNLTIAHFKSLIKNDPSLTDSSFTFVEAPKGEMAIFILLSNESDVNRLKITSPGFFHLQATHFMSHKHLIADVVTIIGTQDIVFGEVDR